MPGMERFRVPVLALVVVGLAATVSLAGPPSSTPPDPANEGAPGQPSLTQALQDEDVVEPEGDGAVAPDHSACEGLIGLENAACRVRANLEAHPNRGLENALSRLEANLAKVDVNGGGPPDHAGGPPDDVEPRGLEVAAALGAPVGAG